MVGETGRRPAAFNQAEIDGWDSMKTELIREWVCLCVCVCDGQRIVGCMPRAEFIYLGGCAQRVGTYTDQV